MIIDGYVYPEWMILVWALDCIAALAAGLWIHMDKRRK